MIATDFYRSTTPGIAIMGLRCVRFARVRSAVIKICTRLRTLEGRPEVNKVTL